MAESNYDKLPFIAIPDAVHECVIGWEKIATELQHAIAKRRTEKPILVVDCYSGVDESAVLNELQSRLAPRLTIHAADAYHSSEKIDQIITPFLAHRIPESDSGRPRPRQSDQSAGSNSASRWSPADAERAGASESLSRGEGSRGLSLVNFFNAEPLWRFRRTIDELKGGLVLIIGCGASLIAWGHILVYADLARREVRQRLQRNETGNLGADNKSLPLDQQYKRALLMDWPLTDRWKRPLIERWDYVLDTNNPSEPKLADAEDVRRGLHCAARRPFRLIPVFDSLEESSFLLGFGDLRFEVPAIDLLFNQPRALLGQAVHARFGDHFPIPFDFLRKENLVNRFEPLANGDGWREERLVLSEREMMEVRRHWFSKTLAHETHGSINVLNLLEGDEAIAESPDAAFEPFVLHPAETFIVPAAVGRYNIRPRGPSAGKEIATIKAFVRTP